jgi:oxygen-independent coproporphyrinogen-3 oxidase
MIDERPRWIAPRSAYIHVPFCAHKCGYCDFASVANAEDQIDDYLVALDLEMARVLGKPRGVETIFIGGGTPTYLNSEQLDVLLASINRWLPLSMGGEFTVEANPNTLDESKIEALVRGGVNRVSLGAQSFEPAMLTRLERNHDPASVARAVDLLKARGVENFSLDLIFGRLAPRSQTIARIGADPLLDVRPDVREGDETLARAAARGRRSMRRRIRADDVPRCDRHPFK